MFLDEWNNFNKYTFNQVKDEDVSYNFAVRKINLIFVE